MINIIANIDYPVAYTQCNAYYYSCHFALLIWKFINVLAFSSL